MHHHGVPGTVKWLVTLSPDSIGAGAIGLMTLVGWFMNSINITLFTLVVFTMLLDIIVGAMRAVVDPLTQYDRRRILAGLAKKAFWLLIIPTASVVDALYAISPFPLNEIVGSYFPITIMTMYALAAAEISSILDHFKNGGVAPSAIAVIMRHVDKLKIGQEPPRRRHYDLAARAEEEILDESDRIEAEREKRTGH